MLVSSSKTTSGVKSTVKSNAKTNASASDILSITGFEEPSKELRPKGLNSWVGQKNLVKQLKIILESSKIRDEMPEHVLFYGQPGLGKTTLASLIATELGVNFKTISAPAIQKSGDMVSLLLNLEPNTVLFIDEIHRLKAPIEELLYTAMEDRVVDLVLGKGQGAVNTRMDLVDFTLVGATTKLGKISKPLQDRFTSVFQLQLYDNAEIQAILERNLDILKLDIDYKALIFLSSHCRGTPRVANNLLRRLRDYQTVHYLEKLDLETVTDFLKDLGVFHFGLTRQDMQYLKALSQNDTLGVKTLAGILLEETDTLEDVREPYLIHLGLIDKSVEGRKLTARGKEFVASYI
jgi:holliday junction DNA helicase RuvB